MVDFFFRRKGVLAAAVHILTYLLATPGYSQLTGETVSIIDTLGYRLRMSRNSEDSVNALNKCANDLNREGQVNGKDYAEKALEIAIRTGFIKSKGVLMLMLTWHGLKFTLKIIALMVRITIRRLHPVMKLVRIMIRTVEC
jgi:hypothetical protein